MEIKLDKKDNTSALLTVKLVSDDYKTEVEDQLGVYRKNAKMKGFRPGKVPKSLIKKMYGTNVKIEKVNDLLSKSVHQYIVDEKLPLVGRPLPVIEKAQAIDWQNQEEFEFEYELGMAANVPEKIQDSISVKNYKIELTDKEIDETIDNLRESFTNTIEPESVAKGDFVTGQLTAEEGDFDKEVMIPTNKVTTDGQKYFDGKTVETEFNFALTDIFENDKDASLALGIKEEEVAELKNPFKFKVTKITRNEKGEVNQELFDKVLGEGKVTNEEDFRAEVKKLTEENFKRESDNVMLFELRKTIVDESGIELPETFLKKWLADVNQDAKEEDIEKELPNILKDFKWVSFRDKIANSNSIEVEEKEVFAEAEKMFRMQYRLPMNAEDDQNDEIKNILSTMVRNYLTEDNAKNYMSLRDSLLSEKVLRFAAEKVNVVEENVSVDKFKEIVDEINNTNK